MRVKWAKGQGGTEILSDPLIKFHQIIPGAPAPRRADPTLLGSIPLRAHQFCEPFIAASGFGWYLYPPIDFSLMWDGTAIVWRPRGEQRWRVLETAAVPGFPEHYQAEAPQDGSAPNPFPFLIAIREPGIIQLWTGCMARTREGWVSLVRAPANLPSKAGYEVLEGIVETDWWFGPIFANLRLYQTGYPVRLQKGMPLFQLQAIPREALDDKALNDFEVLEGLEHFTTREWEDLSKAVRLRGESDDKAGGYRREVRRRRKEREGSDPEKG